MQTTSGGYAQTCPKDESDDLCALADEEMDPANEVRIIASQLRHHQNHAPAHFNLLSAMHQATSKVTILGSEADFD